ncbi:hypothetical protein EPN90_01055 [Patescibacteria group bacterium]|nr:MAG: hypothetical protein EPN90_01055 [Patescibacteria group bacterium]
MISRKQLQKWIASGLIAATGVFVIINPLFATEVTSTNFKILDPVISMGGVKVTSSNFTVLSAFGQVSIGESTSTSYKVRSGFEYFPVATAPVLSATAGAEKVSLSWTASVGSLGWTVTSYDVCIGTSSNTYSSCTDIGNVTSYNATSLTAGTTYFFRLRAKTVFGVVIVRSNEASAVPTAAAAPAPSGGGGGGGGGAAISETAAAFSGFAYPRSLVVLLKDAKLAGTVQAAADARFDIKLGNITGGNYIFSIYSDDKDNLRSAILSFPVTVASGQTLTVSGVYLSPTITSDKTVVKRNDSIHIFGQTVPGSVVTVSIQSDPEQLVTTKADTNGVYSILFDSGKLSMGKHIAKAKSIYGSQFSLYGTAIDFEVGTETVLRKLAVICPQKGDVNNDCKVNLVDFSIAAYWWKRTLTNAAKTNVDAKLFPDGVINLRDFSIMAFYWTG